MILVATNIIQDGTISTKTDAEKMKKDGIYTLIKAFYHRFHQIRVEIYIKAVFEL